MLAKMVSGQYQCSPAVRRYAPAAREGQTPTARAPGVGQLLRLRAAVVSVVEGLWGMDPVT
jgi:hypothetical protein